MHVWYVYMHKHIYVSKPICCKYGSLVNTYLHIWHTLKIHIYFKMVQKKGYDLSSILPLKHGSRWLPESAICIHFVRMSRSGGALHPLASHVKKTQRSFSTRTFAVQALHQSAWARWSGWFFLDTKSHIFWSPKLKGFLKAWVWECSGHVEAEG